MRNRVLNMNRFQISVLEVVMVDLMSSKVCEHAKFLYREQPQKLTYIGKEAPTDHIEASRVSRIKGALKIQFMTLFDVIVKPST